MLRINVAGRNALQLFPVNLAHRIARQFINDDEALAKLVGGEPRGEIVVYFRDNRLVSILGEPDETEHTLTEHYADHRSFLGRRMGGDNCLLNLNGPEVGTTANDDVLLARHEDEFVFLPAPH